MTAFFEELELSPARIADDVLTVMTDMRVQIRVGDQRVYTLRASSRMKVYQLMVLIEAELNIPLRNQRGLYLDGRQLGYFRHLIMLFGVRERSEIFLVVKEPYADVPLIEREAHLKTLYPEFLSQILDGSYTQLSSEFIREVRYLPHRFIPLIENHHFDILDRYAYAIGIEDCVRNGQVELLRIWYDNYIGQGSVLIDEGLVNYVWPRIFSVPKSSQALFKDIRKDADSLAELNQKLPTDIEFTVRYKEQRFAVRAWSKATGVHLWDRILKILNRSRADQIVINQLSQTRGKAVPLLFSHTLEFQGIQGGTEFFLE